MVEHLGVHLSECIEDPSRHRLVGCPVLRLRVSSNGREGIDEVAAVAVHEDGVDLVCLWSPARDGGKVVPGGEPFHREVTSNRTPLQPEGPSTQTAGQSHERAQRKGLRPDCCAVVARERSLDGDIALPAGEVEHLPRFDRVHKPVLVYTLWVVVFGVDLESHYAILGRERLVLCLGPLHAPP